MKRKNALKRLTSLSITAVRIGSGKPRTSDQSVYLNVFITAARKDDSCTTSIKFCRPMKRTGSKPLVSNRERIRPLTSGCQTKKIKRIRLGSISTQAPTSCRKACAKRLTRGFFLPVTSCMVHPPCLWILPRKAKAEAGQWRSVKGGGQAALPPQDLVFSPPRGRPMGKRSGNYCASAPELYLSR